MLLKSFGCSFIYGSELADDDGNFYLPHNTHLGSKSTWPALLAKDLNYNYTCHAAPAAGNLQILENVLNHACADLVVISWSWIDRFDYVNQHGRYENGNLIDNFWSTIVPADNSNLAQTYYRHIHNQYSDKLKSLVYVKTAIDYLKACRQPFIMTYLDELMFETQWHSSKAIADLQEYIRPHMFKFNGLTFVDWSNTNQFPISKNFHPLEQAHRAAADYILELGIHKI